MSLQLLEQRGFLGKQEIYYILAVKGNPDDPFKALFLSIDSQKQVRPDPEVQQMFKSNKEQTLDDLVEYLKENGINVKRGDVISSVSLFYIKPHIFDGLKFILLIREIDLYVTIPKQFPVIDEFPIHYWDNVDSRLNVKFDHKPYLKTLLTNLRSISTGGPENFFVDEIPYLWTSFDVQEKYIKPYNDSDTKTSLIKDLNDIVRDYLKETYYIIFTEYGFEPPSVEDVSDALLEKYQEIRFLTNSDYTIKHGIDLDHILFVDTRGNISF